MASRQFVRQTVLVQHGIYLPVQFRHARQRCQFAWLQFHQYASNRTAMPFHAPGVQYLRKLDEQHAFRMVRKIAASLVLLFQRVSEAPAESAVRHVQQRFQLIARTRRQQGFGHRILAKVGKLDQCLDKRTLIHCNVPQSLVSVVLREKTNLSLGWLPQGECPVHVFGSQANTACRHRPSWLE